MMRAAILCYFDGVLAPTYCHLQGTLASPRRAFRDLTAPMSHNVAAALEKQRTLIQARCCHRLRSSLLLCSVGIPEDVQGPRPGDQVYKMMEKVYYSLTSR